MSRMALPALGAPMFIVSTPDLVIAQCASGMVGAFPALNPGPAEVLDEWITRIEAALDAYPRQKPAQRVAPFAVNQIIRQANDRLDHHVCVWRRAPMIITSLRAPNDVVKRIHDYGGVVFHGVISIRHAEKALEAHVDGLMLVCAGAGGAAGRPSPFALSVNAGDSSTGRSRCPAQSPMVQVFSPPRGLAPISPT
jgi:nitronate monooxygenase